MPASRATGSPDHRLTIDRRDGHDSHVSRSVPHAPPTHRRDQRRGCTCADHDTGKAGQHRRSQGRLHRACSAGAEEARLLLARGECRVARLHRRAGEDGDQSGRCAAGCGAHRRASESRHGDDAGDAGGPAASVHAGGTDGGRRDGRPWREHRRTRRRDGDGRGADAGDAAPAEDDGRQWCRRRCGRGWHVAERGAGRDAVADGPDRHARFARRPERHDAVDALPGRDGGIDGAPERARPRAAAERAPRGDACRHRVRNYRSGVHGSDEGRRSYGRSMRPNRCTPLSASQMRRPVLSLPVYTLARRCVTFPVPRARSVRSRAAPSPGRRSTSRARGSERSARRRG